MMCGGIQRRCRKRLTGCVFVGGQVGRRYTNDDPPVPPPTKTSTTNVVIRPTTLRLRLCVAETTNQRPGFMLQRCDGNRGNQPPGLGESRDRYS